MGIDLASTEKSILALKCVTAQPHDNKAIFKKKQAGKGSNLTYTIFKQPCISALNSSIAFRILVNSVKFLETDR